MSVKKYKNFILICLFFFNSIISYSFRISNIDFDQRIDKNGYQEYKLYNDSTKRVRYKVFLKDTGKLKVSKALEIYPKVITIEPKDYAVLKIFGKGGIELPKEEHQFILSFKPIIIPTLSKASEKKNTVSGSAIVPLAPDIKMSGYVGEIDFSKSLFVRDINFYKNNKGNLVANLKLENKAYAGVSVALGFTNSERNIFESKAIGRIEKNSVINVEVELKTFKNDKDIKYIEFYNSSLGTIVEQEI